MITRAPFVMTLIALVPTACAMALGSPETDGSYQSNIIGQEQSQSFACVLVAQVRPDGGTRLEARLEAKEAIRASFDLRVRGAGVSVDQSGELSLGAGENALLGEAEFSAALSALDAKLTVTANGSTVTCPLQPS